MIYNKARTLLLAVLLIGSQACSLPRGTSAQAAQATLAHLQTLAAGLRAF